MASASSDLCKAALENLIDLRKKAHKEKNRQTPLAEVAKDFARPALANWSDLLEIHDIVKHFAHAFDTMPEHSKGKFPSEDKKARAEESMRAIKSHFKAGQVPKAFCFCASLPENWWNGEEPKEEPAKIKV